MKVTLEIDTLEEFVELSANAVLAPQVVNIVSDEETKTLSFDITMDD